MAFLIDQSHERISRDFGQWHASQEGDRLEDLTVLTAD
jgi:hypothetical protein